MKKIYFLLCLFSVISILGKAQKFTIMNDFYASATGYGLNPENITETDDYIVFTGVAGATTGWFAKIIYMPYVYNKVDGTITQVDILGGASVYPMGYTAKDGEVYFDVEGSLYKITAADGTYELVCEWAPNTEMSVFSVTTMFGGTKVYFRFIYEYSYEVTVDEVTTTETKKVLGQWDGDTTDANEDGIPDSVSPVTTDFTFDAGTPFITLDNKYEYYVGDAGNGFQLIAGLPNAIGLISYSALDVDDAVEEVIEPEGLVSDGTVLYFNDCINENVYSVTPGAASGTIIAEPIAAINDVIEPATSLQMIGCTSEGKLIFKATPLGGDVASDVYVYIYDSSAAEGSQVTALLDENGENISLLGASDFIELDGVIYLTGDHKTTGQAPATNVNGIVQTDEDGNIIYTEKIVHQYFLWKVVDGVITPVNTKMNNVANVTLLSDNTIIMSAAATDGYDETGSLITTYNELALFDPNTYVMAFDYDESAVINPNTEAEYATVDELKAIVAALQEAQMVNQTFDGWYTTEDFAEGTLVGAIDFDAEGFELTNYTLYPKFSSASSVNSFAEEAYSVYPTKAISNITIEASTAVSVEIYNVVGYMVQKARVASGVQTVSVDDLTKGVYVVILKDEKANVTYTTKIIKQ